MARYAPFADAAFVVGSSPATHDVESVLGTRATNVRIENTGAASLTVAFASKGTYGSELTINNNADAVVLNNMLIGKVRITHVGNTSYNVVAW